MARESDHQIAEFGELSQPTVESSADIALDDNLCSIVSLLKLREAVRTSILSRRWRNLWTYIPNLNFDAFNMFERHMDGYYSPLNAKEHNTRIKKFIRSVYAVLRHHQGSRVKLFRVCFNLTNKHARHLDQWVDYAIRSGAIKLVLNFHESLRSVSTMEESYEFPFHLFAGGRRSSIECLSLTYCTFTLPSNFIGLSSLKVLELLYIYITDRDCENLFSICYAIESLTIHYCRGLVNLYVSHSSGTMKFLYVRYCRDLMKIELDSTIISTFEYHGHRVTFSLKKASRVVKACIMMDNRGYAMKYSLTEFVADFPQLEALFLSDSSSIEVGTIPNSYKFTHLKQLALSGDTELSYNVLGLAFFLSFAPSLEKFHVQLTRSPYYTEPQEICLPNHVHKHLKQFEIGGFEGRKDETELVSYVLMNASALEQVTIDLYTRWYSPKVGWVTNRGGSRSGLDGDITYNRAKKHLSRVDPLSSSVKLVYLPSLTIDLQVFKLQKARWLAAV